MRGLYSDSTARCANAVGRSSHCVCVCLFSSVVLSNRIEFPLGT